MGLYAATYPDAVVGMVLVDAVNEYVRAALRRRRIRQPSSGLRASRHLGWITRTSSGLTSMPRTTCAECVVAAQPLHELPLMVLSRSREDTATPEMVADLPPGFLDAAADAHRAGRAQLAALVPDARHVIATDSGHYIQLEQSAKALVIEAIRQVVEGVRYPNTWSDLVACCAP